MTHSQRAAVKPRVFGGTSGETILLEDEVARFLESGKCGLIAVVGPPGSGKTTAIQHLAAVFPSAQRLVLVDDFNTPMPSDAPTSALMVYTAQCPLPAPHLAIYHLMPWQKDDVIEYLLAVHPSQCAGIMARVRRSDSLLLEGVPELWRNVLDRLADNPAIPDVRSALKSCVDAHGADGKVTAKARKLCLNALLDVKLDIGRALAKAGCPAPLSSVLRHRVAQLMFGAECIAAELHDRGKCRWLAECLPRELIRAASIRVARDPIALEHLNRQLSGPPPSAHAMSASLLHATGKRWVPSASNPPRLSGAYLEGADWPGSELGQLHFMGADLSGANLRGANLRAAVVSSAKLSAACLAKANLNDLVAVETDFTRTDLSDAVATNARFSGSCFHQARLAGAVLRNSLFFGADLKRADFRGADLTQAHLGADESYALVPDSFTPSGQLSIEEADFTDANLTEADLSGLNLGVAVWAGARFVRAKLHHCNLEDLHLPGADFTEADLRSALLTASWMEGASFPGADLRDTGLADVEWENVDLRRADLRGCSFHMGSSRSGRVGSPIACEGSRTGFYTDEYEEQTYKAPEEIRKANLCNADLRGANLEGVDFYLVDLRGAKVNAEDIPHLRRCGAILERYKSA